MTRWAGDWTLPTGIHNLKTKAITSKKPASKKAASKKVADKTRVRKQRTYPGMSFEDSLLIGKAIQEHASGEKVARLTLLGKLDKSPTSSQTHLLITNSTKYGLTKGSYAAETLELTPGGATVTRPGIDSGEKLKAEFDLAIAGIKPFNHLYEKYKNKRLPAHEVLSDALQESGVDVDDPKECIDIFVVNARYLGVLKPIAGAETLISIETVLAERGVTPIGGEQIVGTSRIETTHAHEMPQKKDWNKVCFYITPIGEQGSDERKHSDLFLSQLVEPALASTNLGLEVVRADQIAEPGIITSQIFEYILKSKLVVVDLSFHNPNVFYEMALRHATKLPIVQICRKKDRIPFDVNSVRTIIIDNNDIYSLLPNIESYKSEIATQVRAAMNGNSGANPISAFLPNALLTIK